jgi:hypothetical protein
LPWTDEVIWVEFNKYVASSDIGKIIKMSKII